MTTSAPRTLLYFFPAPGTSVQPPQVRTVTYTRLSSRWMGLALASLALGALLKVIALATGLPL